MSSSVQPRFKPSSYSSWVTTSSTSSLAFSGLLSSSFFIQFSLRRRWRARRDDTNHAATAFGEDDEQQAAGRIPDDEKPRLRMGGSGVIALKCVRVVEDLDGLAKADAVLLYVGLCLLIVPLEFHRPCHLPAEMAITVVPSRVPSRATRAAGRGSRQRPPSPGRLGLCRRAARRS